MSTSTNSETEASIDPKQLPFVAPCRKLDAKAPLRWLRQGWADLKAAPRQSLAYGLVMLLMSYAVSLSSWLLGNVWVFVGLLSGFIFFGPILAMGLYAVSRELEEGRKPQLSQCFREGLRHLGNQVVFAIVLLIVLLIWARAASMVHVFFPTESDPAVEDLLLFFGVGTTIGALFSGVVFCASAFALPMMMDKRVDAVTAVVTSVNAVLRNKWPMALWATMIVLSVLLSFATALLGLAIALPLVGHATWHAYRETIDASAWPDHDAGKPPA